MGEARRASTGLPEDVKDVFGSALLDVQYGGTPDGAKPFGEGLPHEIWKIVGSKTPPADKDRVRDRFKAAKRDYDEHHRKREK